MQLRGHRTGPRETAGQGGWVMVYSGEESQGATVSDVFVLLWSD